MRALTDVSFSSLYFQYIRLIRSLFLCLDGRNRMEEKEKARREKLLSAATKPAEVISTKIPEINHYIFVVFCRILHHFSPC